jgi:hypothetical protein
VTATACDSCTAAVGDGARLCVGCTRDVALALLTAASIAPDLDDAVARLLKRGSGGKSSSPEPPLPIDLVASDARQRLSSCLMIWVLRMRPAPGTVLLGITAMAKWLASHLGELRQYPRARAAHHEIRAAVARAVQAVDRLPECAPAGTCERCGAQLLAELGADTVTCACGLRLDGLREQRARRAAAADVLGTASEIASAREQIGIHVSASTIRKWASRGRLGARPGPKYAMSDVLVLCAQRDTR